MTVDPRDEDTRRLDTLLSNLPGAAYRCLNDRQWSMQVVNDGVRALTGYSPQDFLSRTVHIGELTHPEDRDRVWASVQKALEDKRRYRLEYRIRCKSGETKWVWEQGTGVYSDDGELRFLEGFITDVTEQVTANRERQERETRLQSILDTATEAIVTMDERGLLESFNPAAETLFGYSAEEAIGQPASILIPPDQRPLHDAGFEGYLRTGERKIIGIGREVSGLRKDGTVLPLRLSVSEWRHGDMTMFTGIFQDLSEEKQAQAVLRESEARFRTLVENAPVGIKETDLHGRILSMNPAGLKILGAASEGAVCGRLCTEIISGEQRAQFQEHIRQAARGQVSEFHFEIQRADGAARQLFLTLLPIYGQGPEAERIMGLIQDVTDRRNAQQKLIQAAKMAALGDMAGKIAHEVNNPISIIAGRARLRLSDPKVDLPAKVREDYEKIAEQCDRIGFLTRSLLDYCRPAVSPKAPVDINLPVRKALSLAQDKAKRWGVTVSVDLAEGLPPVHGNAIELEQVFLNLALNAIDALSSKHGGTGGTLRVTSADSDGVVVSFQDDGPGIASDVKGRLFEPFFTTKEGKGGTGLGLPVCHGIVQEHGGEIVVNSSLGEGTEFQILFPRYRGKGTP